MGVAVARCERSTRDNAVHGFPGLAPKYYRDNVRLDRLVLPTLGVVGDPEITVRMELGPKRSALAVLGFLLQLPRPRTRNRVPRIDGTGTLSFTGLRSLIIIHPLPIGEIATMDKTPNRECLICGHSSKAHTGTDGCLMCMGSKCVDWSPKVRQSRLQLSAM